MANLDAAFGLKPLRMRDGSPFVGAVNKYVAKSTYATALFVGDPVVRVAGGSNTTVVQGLTETHEIGALPEIEKATAGDANVITGVIVGFEATTDRDLISGTASTERVVLVADDPDVVFEIQADGSVAAADIGLNANLIFTNAGSTTTGLSGVELDTTCDAPAADASNQLRIVGVSKDPENNELGSANVNLEVVINQHSEAPGALGI
jgi:hypothetical protein